MPAAPPPAPGPRTGPATQQDVALAAGVSRGLVSLALKGEGRMSDETRRRILRTARTLGYRTNTAAAELAARRSSRLAVIVPYLDNPFFDVLLRCLRRHAADAGHVLVAFVSDLEDSLEHTTVDDVLSMRPAGLLLPGTSMSEDELTALAGQVPLCVIDRDLETGIVPVVRLDEADAARRIAAHLAAQGLTNLSFFSPAPGLQELLLDERRGACRAAAGAAGLAFTEVTCDDGASAALARARAELGAPLGAVAYNDVLGIDVLAATLAAHLEPGRDVALVSYDNSQLAARRQFSLTSIDQSPDRLARAAITALLSPARTPAARVTVQGSLVVRASSLHGPARQVVVDGHHRRCKHPFPEDRQQFPRGVEHAFEAFPTGFPEQHGALLSPPPAKHLVPSPAPPPAVEPGHEHARGGHHHYSPRSPGPPERAAPGSGHFLHLRAMGHVACSVRHAPIVPAMRGGVYPGLPGVVTSPRGVGNPPRSSGPVARAVAAFRS